MSEASVRQCFGYPTPRHMPKTERLAKGAVMLSGIVSTETTWHKKQLIINTVCVASKEDELSLVNAEGAVMLSGIVSERGHCERKSA